MALADITLADGQGTPVNHTFTYVRSDANGRVVRSEMAAPAEEPLTLTHAHKDGKVSGKAIRSHLLRVDFTKLDSDGITPRLANIRLMADVDNAILSDALADDMAAYIRNWATSANVRTWLRGSVG